MFQTRSTRLALLTGISLLALVGCTAQDRDNMRKNAEDIETHDKELGYNRDDFRKAMAPRAVEAADASSAVPDLAPVIAEDKKNILPQPLVSITVNQDVPLRDILYELAKQAEVDLELDPTITGSIIFTAYNRPFDQVVERICDISGLRYTFEKNVLRVERDTPFVKTYHVGYLGLQRNYTSSIKSNTSAASGTGGGGGGSNGSSSSVDTKSASDFWAELETNITQIITTSNKQVSLTDQSTPIVMTPQAIPAVSAEQLAAVNPPAANGTPNAAGTSANTGTTNAAGVNSPVPPIASNGVTVNQTAPVAGLANPAGVAATGAGGGAAAAATSSANPYFSVNKQAGLITVFGSQKQHDRVAAYLKDILQAVNTQVAIEAKVFEVELTDQNSFGIDWQLIGNNLNSSFTLPQQLLSVGTTPAGAGAVFTYKSSDLNAVVNAISRFGTVRTLSSPRLSVMNNQTAVLNVSESRVFFKLDVQTTPGTLGSQPTVTVTSTANNVPEGLIMTVHPSVDPDTNEITMNLRPSITRVVNTVNDPAVAYAAAMAATGPDPIDTSGLVSRIPELSIREIDSVVKMNSGNTIIMGGLMQNRADADQIAVPFLSDIPVLGNLFRNKRDLNRKTEMVILLRAVVVNNPEPDQADKDLYSNLGRDRHPVPLKQ